MGVLPHRREERGIRPSRRLSLPVATAPVEDDGRGSPAPAPSVFAQPSAIGEWFGGEKPEGGGPSVHRPPFAWLAAALAAGGSLMLMELAFELADDRGEDMRCLAGLGADHAEPSYGQLVAVNVRFLVEVQSAGEVFQVRHVGEIRLAEPQDGESAGDGVTAHAGRNDLQREVLPAAEAEQVAELIAQDFLASDRPPQRGLLDDRPEPEPSLGEPALPFLAQDDVPFGFADRDVAERENGGRVLLRLQQAGYQLRLVHPDRGRGPFPPQIGR